MLEFYQTCCLLSIFWIVLTMIFGELLDGIGDADLDGLTLGINFSSRSFLFGVVIFGSCGWMLMENASLSNRLIFFISLVIGGLCAWFFEKFIVQTLNKLQSTSSVKESELIGLEAELTEPTSNKQSGKARLVINGNTLDFPAKGTSEDVLPRGTIVTILDLSKGFIIVELKERN